MHVVALVRPSILLVWHAVLLGPAHSLGFLGDTGVQRLNLALPIGPFQFCHNGQLSIDLGSILLMFSSISRRALVLMGVVFSIKLY